MFKHIAKFLIGCFLLVGGAQLAAAQAGIQARATGFDPAQFPRVRAFVSITDAQGKPVQALPQENFKIQEDGRDAEIIAINISTDPIYVGLVIDHSSSMAGAKLPDAKTAAIAFVEQLRANDQAFVIQFDDANQTLTDFTSDQAVLKRAVDSIELRGGTALYDATFVGVEKFQARAEVRKKALIVLTDGQDNREVAWGLVGGSQHTLEEAIAKAKQDGIVVYTVGLGSDADRQRLQKLADETGGRAYFSPGGEELRNLYLLIAEQLQKEYAIDFKSPRPAQDGTRRNVQITVTLPNSETQTVSGVYVAGYLFNRIRTDWVLAALLGLALFGMALAPTGIRMLTTRAPAPQPIVEQNVPPPFVAPVSDTVTCRNCGTVNRATAKFCRNCRASLTEAAPAPTVPQQRVCPNCGNVVREGAKFCGNCRYRLG
ncbi:MAG: hypothetical protein B6D41_01690 [Chloroflexi bacterium UTCFX4]|jgi:Ca-activated chloride channel family protein|nr:MAG: hypothetical protein B6D41_01690 [Chloroflexi bacterium UTCFX4]